MLGRSCRLVFKSDLVSQTAKQASNVVTVPALLALLKYYLSDNIRCGSSNQPPYSCAFSAVGQPKYLFNLDTKVISDFQGQL